MKIEIPTFDEAAARMEAGTADALDVFVHENEPSEPEYAEKFHAELTNLIEHIGRAYIEATWNESYKHYQKPENGDDNLSAYLAELFGKK